MPDVDAFSRQWSQRIAADPLAARVIETLWASREQFAEPVLRRSRAEGSALKAVIAADYARTRDHVLEHFRALLALPATRARDLGEDPMAFVRRHGVRRAQGGVPLQAILQGYRNGHKAFWEAMGGIIRQLAPNAQAALEAAMVLSEYTIEYTDLISVVLTDAYLEEEAKLAEERTRLGLAVVDQLLAGEAPGGEEGWALCCRLGLADGRPMVVAVGRCAPSADGALASRALSLVARGLEAALPLERFGRIVGVRGDTVVAIVASERPGQQVAGALRGAEAALRAEAGGFRVGVGLDGSGIADLPRSYEEALTALTFAYADEAISPLAEAAIDDYLRRTADATARRLAPPLPDSVRAGELGRTLDAFAAANLNVKACARALGVHNNTVYHRLNQVRRLTGLDPRAFAGLSALITARTMAAERAGGG